MSSNIDIKPSLQATKALGDLGLKTVRSLKDPAALALTSGAVVALHKLFKEGERRGRDIAGIVNRPFF